LAKIFYKYLPLATSYAEQQALSYMDSVIEGFDEDHVAHWASEHLTYDEVVNGACSNILGFLKNSGYIGSLEALVAGVTRFAAMFWLERGGIIFPSSVVPKSKALYPSQNFK
jgi:hypothetical protein